MLYKEIYSAIAIALTFIAYYPFIRSILKDELKPHVFSWIIWGMCTLVVFLAQLEGKGGVGAWPIGVSGSLSIVVAILAYIKRADITITRTDWLFFVSAMSSLPLWFFTSDPLWTVVILTTVDILGFGPTVRKAYSHPYSESLSFFALFMLRNLMVIMALENYSIVTVLFPASVSTACILLMSMIRYRRLTLVV
ncbi:MAG: hypothetical protein ACI9SC_000851 [Gammaproteobacteria bacterium]|jgi:hypothetical protein